LHAAVKDVPVLDLKTSTLELALAEERPIAELGVEVDIEHTYRGDLIVKLHPPPECGVEPITLHNGEGAGQNDLKRRFDAASTPDLRQLSGKRPAGTWQLSVYDRYKNDQGTLKRFGLDIVYA
jgi:subtilisin-like proprotein convertase family protein